MTPFLHEPGFVRIVAWELAILYAIFGWGWVFQRILSISCPAMGGAYGLSVVMTLSSIANVTGKFGSLFIIAMVGGGSFAASTFLIHWLPRQKFSGLGTNPGRIFVVSLLLFLALGQFTFRARTMEFSYVDDYQAYMVFPAKLLANGSLGSDPFSERRLVSSLGGKYALDAIVLWGNGFKSLWGTDNAIGLWILLASLCGISRALAMPFWGTMVLCFWSLALGPPAVNLTSVTLAIPIILTLQTLLCTLNAVNSWRVCTAAALLIVALVMLKNSLFPIGALLIAGHLICHAWKQRSIKSLLYALPILVVAFFLFCSTWMIASWRDCGSPWFPLLGYGNSAIAYSTNYSIFNNTIGATSFLEAAWNILRPGPYTPLLLVIIGIHLCGLLGRSTLGHAEILSWVGLVTAFLILLRLPSPLGDRFTFSGTTSATFWGFLILVTKYAKMARVRVFALIFASVAAGFGIWDNAKTGSLNLYSGMLHSPFRAARNIEKMAAGNLVKAQDQLRYAAAQKALPASGVVLDRTLMPFLWDFHRNHIFLADYPGATSPPPGMPIGQGPRALRDYLVDQGVEFVAYDYASEAGLTLKVFGPLANDNQTNVWQRSQYAYSLRVQHDIETLHLFYPRVFNDGVMEIIALGK